MTTTVTGLLCWWDFHPLEWQLASLHRLLAFPMRTGGPWTERPDAGSPSFRRSPSARDVFFDPGRVAVPRITALLILRSTFRTVSAPAMRLFRGSLDTPCNCCVRFVAVVTAGSRNTHYRATRYGLTRTGLAPVGPRQPYWRLRYCGHGVEAVRVGLRGQPQGRRSVQRIAANRTRHSEIDPWSC